MSKFSRRTIVIPVRLGHAADYDQSIFPLWRLKSTAGYLREGDLLLEATMDEMIKIFNMSSNLEGYKRFLEKSKDRYDDLMKQKEKLEQQRKSMNPLKLFATFRETRLLVVAGRRLYSTTRTKSEVALHRVRLSCASSRQVAFLPNRVLNQADRRTGENHEEISGIAVNTDGLSDDTVSGFLSETTSLLSSVNDPFADPDPSRHLCDTPDNSILSLIPTPAPYSSASGTNHSTSSPTTSDSAQSTNHFHIYTYNNAMYNKNSVVKGLTVNNGGFQNSGSVLHDGSPSS